MKMSKHLIWFAFLAIIFLGGCMDTSIPEGNPPTVKVPIEIIEELPADIIDDLILAPVIDEEMIVEVEEMMEYDSDIENLETEVDGLLDEFNVSLEGLE